MDVAIHDIEHISDRCPSDVSYILRSLSCPLPKHLASSHVQECLSPGVCELYEELMQSLPLDQGEIESSGRTVTDVIDTILSCTRMVRAACSFDRGDEQARSGWISVLTVLGIAISNGALILEDVRFLKARTKQQLKVTDVGDLEGKAAILLTSYFTIPTAYEDTVMHINATQSDDESASGSPSDSKESLWPIDVPFDAHVLPGRGKRLNCLLPVVCATTEGEIKDLLTSVLCQRYVLNITLPVVGVSLPEFGTTAKIVIGWLEENEDGVPTVHLAYAHHNGNAHPSIGVFDLLNPASSLHFGQFILRLQPQFSSIKPSMGALTTRKFCWRLDHIDYDHDPNRLSAEASRSEASIPDPFSAEISEPSFDDGVSHAIMPPKGNPNVDKKARNIKGTSSKKSSSEKAEFRPDSEQSSSRRNKGDPGSEVPVDNLLQPPPFINFPVAEGIRAGSEEQLTETSATSKGSRRSASKFARLNPTNLEEMKRGTESWLWERNTLRLHRIPILNPLLEVGEQINEMITKYNLVTRVCWPETWRKASLVPRSNAVHENLRVELFIDFVEYKAKNSIRPEDFAMEPEICLSITNHLSVLFKAIATARICEELVRIGEAPEGAMRSIWDDLLRATCCEPTEASSKCFFVEKSIPLPRNKAAQLGAKFLGGDQARLLHNLGLSQALAASMAHGTQSEIPMAVQLALAAVVTHGQKLQLTGSGVTQSEEERACEPGEAIVDGICCLRYELQEPILEQTETEKAERWWMTSFLKRFFTQESICQGKQPLKTDLEDERQRKLPEARHLSCYMCPSVMPPTVAPSSEVHLPRSQRRQELSIPFLVTEYKRNCVSIHQAFHQGQMYLTFAAEFLAALGMTDYPVWCLVTAGTQGTIIMAWKSTQSTQPLLKTQTTTSLSHAQYNFIIDRYSQMFDLTKPLQALQLMACLHRLYKTQGTLQEKVKTIFDSNPALLTQPKPEILDWMPLPLPRGKKIPGSDS